MYILPFNKKEQNKVKIRIAGYNIPYNLVYKSGTVNFINPLIVTGINT